MAYLYACHFSNGAIKVGRAIDAATRIESHAQRVSCLGVLLSEQYFAEVDGNVLVAETALIQRCTAAASRVHGSEWFEGLEFTSVCSWLDEAATGEHADCVWPKGRGASPDWQALVRQLSGRGWRQTQIASRVGTTQSSISELWSGKTRDPRYSLGEALIALYESGAEAPKAPKVAA